MYSREERHMESDQFAAQALAARLNKNAASVANIHFGIWTVGGTMFGMLLGTDSHTPQLLTAGIYALICGAIGWSVGQVRSAPLRLQALTILRSTEKR
jgi:hypothetical protein